MDKFQLVPLWNIRLYLPRQNNYYKVDLIQVCYSYYTISVLIYICLSLARMEKKFLKNYFVHLAPNNSIFGGSNFFLKHE